MMAPKQHLFRPRFQQKMADHGNYYSSWGSGNYGGGEIKDEPFSVRSFFEDLFMMTDFWPSLPLLSPSHSIFFLIFIFSSLQIKSTPNPTSKSRKQLPTL